MLVVPRAAWAVAAVYKSAAAAELAAAGPSIYSDSSRGIRLGGRSRARGRRNRAVRVAAILDFRVLLHRAGWPVILTDVVIVGGYAVVLLTLLVHVGVNVSGLIATSALLAGIIGLALQEVLAISSAGSPSMPTAPFAKASDRDRARHRTRHQRAAAAYLHRNCRP